VVGTRVGIKWSEGAEDYQHSNSVSPVTMETGPWGPGMIHARRVPGKVSDPPCARRRVGIDQTKSLFQSGVAQTTRPKTMVSQGAQKPWFLNSY
jgi:hypothetical protein